MTLADPPSTRSAHPSRVRGVTLYKRPRFRDVRGALTVAQIGDGLPFVPRRYFFVSEVPSGEARGAHAHRTVHQLLACAHGECVVLVDDGTQREEFVLDSRELALHIEPMVWATEFRFSADAVLMVLASSEYDRADYIENYDEYLSLVRASERVG